MTRRFGHGETITSEQFDRARESVVRNVTDVPLAFATAQPVDLKDFDFLFPDLQTDPNNLLPESAATVANLVRLCKTMIDSPGNAAAGDSDVSALMTYFGQFIDHDITLELASADLPTLTNPALTPLPLDQIRSTLRNTRSATLDLDSVYDLPAPRDPANDDKMLLGRVSLLNSPNPPLKRPNGKDDFNDLPRGPRTADPATDRAARIGDPRNDENTIVAQLHLAFLRAHNKLVERWHSFTEPRRVMRQHYQHLVIHEFLMQVADKKIVKNILKDGPQFFKPFEEPFFMPLEFSVAAFRFGHTMIRSEYDFNVNFNTTGASGTLPASLSFLFTFSALSGQLGDFDTLPENWIIEWENFVGANPRSKARRFDTKLANPLFELPTTQGTTEVGLGAMLAVRNLLRGYLLRMPTGQALATAMGLTPLTVAQIEEVASEVTPAAGEESQVDVLRSSGFAERTPLWYYILAEAAFHAKGKHLGPVASTLIAEVLIGLIQKSENSILRNRIWEPTLPSARNGKFTLEDLLRFAGLLE
ncbi:MAG TPA: heme peroxidase family protein [Pyrinomonadaceae bacterium]|nr:heme peroxidase family protein [Pyrinomonadaceae bacterium]